MKNVNELYDRLVCMAHDVLDGNLANVSTEELGLLIDMIKDCAEAVYYCAKANEK